MGWEASPGARTTLDSEGVCAYQAPNLCVCVKEKKIWGITPSVIARRVIGNANSIGLSCWWRKCPGCRSLAGSGH